MFSPPKRRKTSATTGVAVGASQHSEAHEGARASGPPSFQSPTRSSLARSHPDVLERALSRSPTRRPTSRGNQNDESEQAESRVGLRDRKALRPSLNATASPMTRPRLSGSMAGLSPSRRTSGIQSFTQPPRRVSKKIGPSDLFFGTPVRRQTQPSEQALANTPEDQLASELGNVTRELQMDTGLDGSLMGEDPLEPDLPPTPTELGLEKAPDRPMGLLSSSPSMRHERQMKRIVDPIKGSPLRSLNFQVLGEQDVDAAELALDDELPAAVAKKQKSRRSLTAELRQLENEVAEMERWAGKIETGKGLEADPEGLNKFLSMITSEEASRTSLPVPKQAPTTTSSLLSTLLPFSTNAPRLTRPTSPLPTNPFALQDSSQTRPYLTAFAPLSLNARTTRTGSSRTKILSETHTLTLTAPSPFPANLYNVAVVYATDPEAQSVTSVSVPTSSDSKKRRVPEVLRRWIDRRLANPLLQLDISTLCWGINRYWEASVARARLWAQLDHKYNSGTSARSRKDTPPATRDGVLSFSELRQLIPHLERSTMVVKSKSGPKVLLAYNLTIDDWTGEPQLRPEISVSDSGANGGSNKKINQEAKKLFHALLHEKGGSPVPGVEGGVHIDAVLRATEGALGALFGNS
ncbi:hypothetical protein N7510_010178 [Penicillium lagena]|uniref:uncharacterized protein n=1 Tax=Penicillium lagena TaxID=94218 RepID=UPI002540FB34|nr:uncharacterized protein N7510_010178 [Penicillium lagena]KAJ5605024.1 hypothetical protein N7510_010178 [Penicillium lagena]